MFIISKFFFIILLFLPLATVADSIGISPATIEKEMLQGQELNSFFTIVRSNSKEKEIYKVTIESENLEIIGEEQLILEKKENEKKYDFLIKSSDIEIGEYKAFIKFEPIISEDTKALDVNFKIGLSGRVMLDIVDKLSVENITFLSEIVSTEKELNNNRYKILLIIGLLIVLIDIIIFLIWFKKSRT